MKSENILLFYFLLQQSEICLTTNIGVKLILISPTGVTITQKSNSEFVSSIESFKTLIFTDLEALKLSVIQSSGAAGAAGAAQHAATAAAAALRPGWTPTWKAWTWS